MLSRTTTCSSEGRTVVEATLCPAGPAGLLSLSTHPILKRTFDIVVAMLLCIPALPLILLLALLVKLTSRGPAFYSQIRLGLNGRPFRIYKLRSMVVESEKNGACWSQPGDTRVTRVGRFLRKSHCDELPQLCNVLRGDMSLVGPRPERPEFVPSLEQAVSRYRDRLMVRPGLTGLAQVQLPPDSDLESVRRKVACDLYYIRHLTLWLDVRLILVTSFYLLGHSCLSPCKLLRIPMGENVEHNYQQPVRERERLQPQEQTPQKDSDPALFRVPAAPQTV